MPIKQEKQVEMHTFFVVVCARMLSSGLYRSVSHHTDTESSRPENQLEALILSAAILRLQLC